MSSAVLEELLGPSLQLTNSPAPPNLNFGEIGYGYRPGRSFGLSVIVHQVALVLIVVCGRLALIHSVEVVPRHFVPMQVDNVLYLPTIGGGSEGMGEAGGGAGSSQAASSGLRARSRRGFAYPGVRPSISDPPHASLGVQTILQPSLKNAPLLRRDLPLPDITQAPPAAAVEPPKPVIKVQSGRRAIRMPDKPVSAPKLKLPTATSTDLSNLTVPENVMPQAPPPKPALAPAELAEAPVDRRAERAMLVLNAVPPPPGLEAKVPLAEERSRFAVAPDEATVIADPAAGARGGGRPSMAAGSGNQSDISTGDAVADLPAGGGTGKGAGASGTGSGGRYGAANGSGVNSMSEGSGGGRGAAAGVGTGIGVGTTLGSGKGSGSAPGSGVFQGITVRGGAYGNGNSGGLRPTINARRQTSYQMTISSTASSGGGLPDFGVFQNEKVYTVYLDMRANDEDTAPSWTLQYAVQQPKAENTPSRIHGSPIPPYAILKEIPQLGAELAAQCAHKLVIVAGIMNVEGRLEQLSVKQSPDLQLNALLTEALGNWTFQPAQLDGKPVPLKIMLGIRLTPR